MENVLDFTSVLFNAKFAIYRLGIINIANRYLLSAIPKTNKEHFSFLYKESGRIR